MATVNGSAQKDFIHRFGDGLVPFPGYNDVTGVTTGDDTINGFAGDDIIFADAGNDTLNGGLGADAMTGGTGDDTYVVDSAGDSVTEIAGGGIDRVRSSISYTLGANVEALFLIGTANIAGFGNAMDNTIVGNPGENELAGGGENDLIRGGAGNDTLNGGYGNDTLIGETGDDTYFVENAADSVTENADEGIDTVRSSIAYTLGANFENLALNGSASINGTGNELDNTITGNFGSNVLNGGDGNDTLSGGPGDSGIDTLNGGAGNDTLGGGGAQEMMAGGIGNDTYLVFWYDSVTESPGEGTDTVQSWISYTLGAEVENLTLIESFYADTGTGNALDNTIIGNDRDNTLHGGGGNDTLIGGGGHDVLYSGYGNDTLSGGLGEDWYYVETAGDSVNENPGEGIDTVFSSITYTLGPNVDQLRLNGAADVNGTGNTLANWLTGNAGDNVLGGGEGIDGLTGGNGLDSFLFDSPLDAATNVDLISDFNRLDDKVLLSASVFAAAGAPGTLSASAFSIGTGAQDADDRIIYDNVTGALSYDSDGTGAASATQFATLSTGLALTNTNFQIV